MSKPEDIPQDIWDKAEGCFPGNSWNPLGIERVARAILAAKAEEREACAQEGDLIAATYAEAVKDLPADHYKVPYRLHRQNAAVEVAAAIRKRGEGQ